MKYQPAHYIITYTSCTELTDPELRTQFLTICTLQARKASGLREIASQNRQIICKKLFLIIASGLESKPEHFCKPKDALVYSQKWQKLNFSVLL